MTTELTEKQNDRNLRNVSVGLIWIPRLQRRKRHTPRLTARIARSSSAPVSIVDVKWNAAGRRTAMTLIIIKDEFNWVATSEEDK